MTMHRYPKQVMTPAEMESELSRLAAEVVRAEPDLTGVVLVGILRRGVPLAERLRKKIEKQAKVQLPIGTLDITFYRDDLSLVDAQPVVEGSHLDFEITNRDVILVDDVLYTGRTTRAALESILDYGRPKHVRLAVLVDRGCRELPIHADFVGRNVETGEEEAVEVQVAEVDGQDGVFITTKKLLSGS